MTGTVATAVANTVVRTVEIEHTDPVFAGHYPGFPILPGVALIELVHAVVTETRLAEVTFPITIDRVRFHQPVRPGAVLRVEVTLGHDGVGIAVTATVSTESGPVAEMRMRYATRARGGHQ